MAFEPVRGASLERLAIARFATDLVQRSMELRSGGRVTVLEEAFRQTVRPLNLVEVNYRAIRAAAIVDGRIATGALQLEPHATAGHEQMTAEAVAAMQWSLSAIAANGLDLRGQKFVLLGGTAELSPLALLLDLGADVLTTHSSQASLERRMTAEPGSIVRFPGRLFSVPGGIDLLATPVEFAATITEFAAGDAVHIGALAYKGGQGREWRLAAAMDAIIRYVRRADLLRSVFAYLTPSMTVQLSHETAAVAARRLTEASSSRTALARALTLGTLFRPNLVAHGDTHWPRPIIPEQGASYFAANLLGKVYAAEVYAHDRQHSGMRLRVSANVAPMTRTASNATPAAEAAFSEVERLGVRVFPAAVVRHVMGLLMLHDLFSPEAADAELFAKQFHGGVFTHPWSLNSVLKQAYVTAMLKRWLD